MVKEQPKPATSAATKKRKVYSLTNTDALGTIEMIDTDVDFLAPIGKCMKTPSGSSAQVQFKDVTIPKDTRKSTHSAKSNSKKDIKELFKRLGQEFGAVAKTFEEILQVVE